MITRIITFLYEQGKITEENYKKYLLSEDDYLPPLIDKE